MFEDDLNLHIRSGYPVIYIPTSEESRIDELIMEVAKSPERLVRTWDFVTGYHDLGTHAGKPPKALQEIEQAPDKQPTIFVLHDFHRFLRDVATQRTLRNLVKQLASQPSSKTVIITAPILDIPPELAEDITILDLVPPSYDAIVAEFERMLASSKDLKNRLEPGAQEALIKACQGLMISRIRLVWTKAVAEYGQLDTRAIHLALEEKKQQIRRTEVLEFYPVTETIEDIGGLDNLKQWLNQRAGALSEDARSYGLPYPKGMMMVGIQGTGKSLSAKAAASLWQLPLLRMDVGRLMGSLVGESEQRTREAIRIAEAIAPCLLWIDEIEKSFAGIGTGRSGDGGTSSRVFGTLITWMQEKTVPVFVVATANSIEALPPELLRKGRFDEIFFIGLPSERERREIFEVHLRRVRETRLRDFDIGGLARLTDGYSGAEIEQAIFDAMHVAFEARREFNTDDISEALDQIVPLSRTMEERIERIQQWAEAGRARPASSELAADIAALPTRRDQTVRAAIRAANMPEEVAYVARREQERMAQMHEYDPDRNNIRTYLDWLIRIPWRRQSEDNLDVAQAEAVLNTDHYGLDEVKKRLLEFLATRKLRIERGKAGQLINTGRPSREGVILCLVGPPGVGKTSLGASIARAMGREFARISLGGIRDEAEIRGFRRTYVGSQPGRIVQTMARVGTRNPVILLDEVDKIMQVSSHSGDPTSALLEVLDPAQNHSFHDHYLEVPLDLSDVLFIATANEFETIPRPLLDRMEVIQLGSYTEREKLQIAQGYLVPRQLYENGLNEGELTLTNEAMSYIVRHHTLEAGVRGLERQIGAICRRVATRLTAGESYANVIDVPEVIDLLGEGFNILTEIKERVEIPGVALGLAKTATGGDVLYVEATAMPGRKGFRVTGKLGEVAQESAATALSYVRSQAEFLGLPNDFFDNHDIHLHMPDGATPKDGPSAGVAMVTALASLFTGRPVRPDVAMTGEITLRGQVLSVGGIKEKTLGAHRVGLKRVIIPARDRNQLDDIPDYVKDDIEFILASTIEDVLKAALTD